jgi:SPP1 family predicted phage head-tail adaptor
MPIKHNASELKYRIDVLAADGATVKVANQWAGIIDLSGRRLEQAQLVSSETTHQITIRHNVAVDSSCFILSDGVRYIVDYLLDPGFPRRGVWTEIYCHVSGDGA